MCDDACDVDILSLMSLIMSMIYFVELDERVIIYSDSFLHHYFLYLFITVITVFAQWRSVCPNIKRRGGGCGSQSYQSSYFPL